MTVWEHLAQLRRLLFWVVGSVVLAAGCVHYWREPVITFLLQPLGDTQAPLQFLSPLDPLYFILKIDFTLGLLLSLPFILCIVWRYIAPAVSLRWYTPLLVGTLITILSGLAMAYAYLLVVPIILAFMSSIVIPGTATAFTASGYLSFLLTTTSILVLVFQIPLILATLCLLRLMTPAYIRQHRPYFHIGALVLAAIVTPTTDIFTLGLVAGPAIVAIELGAVLGSLVSRNQ